MMCNVCGKNPATVHLTEIIDNHMNELHLCEECARAKSSQMENQFGLSDLLAGMADFEKPLKDATVQTAQCPACGLTYADFKKIGRLGCGECYTSFKKLLGPLLKRIHGASQHLGKNPGGIKAKGGAISKNNELQDLRKKLQRAVEIEAFEEAARLRDEIRQIENQSSDSNDQGNSSAS